MKLSKAEIAMVGLLLFTLLFFILSRMISAIVSVTAMIQVIAFFCFTVIHGKNTLGGKNTVIFIIVAYIITLLIEYMGTLGFFYPFFYWQYTDMLGPMFMGKVPYIIPLTWLTFLYCVWTMTNIIFNRIHTDREHLGKVDTIKKVLMILLVSFIAGLFMTAWDLINDPVMVARGYCYWPEGGAYYGIPIGNFVGWVVIATLVYLVFNFYLGLRGKNQTYYCTEDGQNSQSTLLVVMPYLLILVFDAVVAIPIGVAYSIPWAGIPMGIVMGLTIWRYYKLKAN